MGNTVSNRRFAAKAFGAAIIAASTLGASSASAVLVAESSIITTTAVLAGVNDGGGFSEPWNPQSANDFALNPTSLTFGPLVTAGKSVAGGNAFERHGRRLNTNPGGLPDTLGLVSDPFTPRLIDRNTVWFSALARPTASLGGNAILIAFTNANGGNQTAISAGDIVIRGGAGGGSGGNWGVSTDGGETATGLASTSTPVTAGETVLLIGKFDFIGASLGEFRLWAYNNPNQVTLGGPDLTNASAMATLTGQTVEANASGAGSLGMSFRTLIIQPGNGAGQAGLDEFRFGTTFADVTPVPEPVSLAIAGMAAAGLLARRRGQGRNRAI